MLLKSGPPVHSLRTTPLNGPNSVRAYLPSWEWKKDPVLEKLHSLVFLWNTRQCTESTNQAILPYYLYL